MSVTNDIWADAQPKVQPDANNEEGDDEGDEQNVIVSRDVCYLYMNFHLCYVFLLTFFVLINTYTFGYGNFFLFFNYFLSQYYLNSF